MEEVIKDEDNVLILLSSLLDEEYETFVLTLINDKASLSYNSVPVALVNHEVRRKDKEFSSNSTIAEALLQEEIVLIIRKEMEMLVSSSLVIANWERSSVLSAGKKDIKRLIIQDSRRRRNRNLRQTLHRQIMVLILTLQCCLSLLLLLFAIQRNLSGFWIRALPIMFVPNGSLKDMKH